MKNFYPSVTPLLPSPAILSAMDTQSPLITSFIIRFVQNETQETVEDTSPHPYRGSIRHIQSDEEMSFHLWEEAVEFIRRYVPLEVKKGADGA